jgi:hypothetical protein
MTIAIERRIVCPVFPAAGNHQGANAMIDDTELLQRFVTNRDESSFAALVERYKGLVYGSTLRQTNNAALAQEITQAVFIVLARKASKQNRSGSVGLAVSGDALHRLRCAQGRAPEDATRERFPGHEF